MSTDFCLRARPFPETSLYGAYVVLNTKNDQELLSDVAQVFPVLVKQIQSTGTEVELNIDTLQFILHTDKHPLGPTFGWKCEGKEVSRHDG